MAEKTANHFTNVITASKNVIRKSFLPGSIIVRVNEYSRKTSYFIQGCAKLLYISKGNGELTINGVPHRVKAGSCFLLSFYHFFKLNPDMGDTLELYYCMIPFTSLQLFFSSPNSIFGDFAQLENTPHCNFNPEMQKVIMRLLNDMRKKSGLDDIYFQNLFLYEALIYLNREKDDGKQKNTAEN